MKANELMIGDWVSHFAEGKNCVVTELRGRTHYNRFFEKMHEAGYEWNNEKKELKKIKSKTLDADKVIEWLECKAFQGWAEPIDIRPIIRKFKKDFHIEPPKKGGEQ